MASTTRFVASAFLFVALASLSAAVPSQNLVERATCAKGVHMFVSRGHITPEGRIGPLSSLVNKITKAIPGSDFISTPYPSDPGDKAAALSEIGPGGKVLTSNITSYVAQCPKVPIVLIGYSEGAVITMDTLCGASSIGLVPTEPLPSKFASNIIGTIVYGDESRAAAQPYNEGTCETFGTLTRLNPAGCDAFASGIRSYCDSGDPFCCVGGTDKKVHTVYPSEDDNAATQFILNKYKAFRAK